MRQVITAAIPLSAVLLLANPAWAQTDDGSVVVSLPGIPVIGTRYFGGGSAKITVTGAIQMDREIAINTEASYGDGEMTWIQFGVSGLAEPNVLVTYGGGDLGIILGGGGKSATAEGANCTGQARVGTARITGTYRCREVVSYEPKTGKMAPIAITITFTADTR